MSEEIKNGPEANSHWRAEEGVTRDAIGFSDVTAAKPKMYSEDNLREVGVFHIYEDVLKRRGDDLEWKQNLDLVPERANGVYESFQKFYNLPDLQLIIDNDEGQIHDQIAKRPEGSLKVDYKNIEFYPDQPDRHYRSANLNVGDTVNIYLEIYQGKVTQFRATQDREPKGEHNLAAVLRQEGNNLRKHGVNLKFLNPDAPEHSGRTPGTNKRDVYVDEIGTETTRFIPSDEEQKELADFMAANFPPDKNTEAAAA